MTEIDSRVRVGETWQHETTGDRFIIARLAGEHIDLRAEGALTVTDTVHRRTLFREYRHEADHCELFHLGIVREASEYIHEGDRGPAGFSFTADEIKLDGHTILKRSKKAQERPQATEAPDMVEHPPHYTSDPSGVECIEITRHRNFNIGNALKYLWRAGLKDGNSDVQDLKKAVWYIEDEIKRISEARGPHDNIDR